MNGFVAFLIGQCIVNSVLLTIYLSLKIHNEYTKKDKQ
jgi:hypothetical protein